MVSDFDCNPICFCLKTEDLRLGLLDILKRGFDVKWLLFIVRAAKFYDFSF